ncbi:MAG: molybdate ABC transporter substrate-binding protein [Sulfurovum sp.]|nr:molybdate ABC transporter substrate-binding protein [Sulfurovum sp.]
MKTKLLLSLLLLSTYGMAGTIKIAVAANVSYAMDELKKEFNILYPETEVQVTLGSSGKLTAQIKNGAPYQLFMSANMKYPNTLYTESMTITRPRIYAQGSLAYLSNKKQDFTTGMELLKSNKIAKIAIANPKTAPYGKAAVEAMKNAGVYDDVKSKYVFAETVSQTVTYTVTATDIGFIAKSSLYSPQMSHFKEGIHWADVDSKLYTPIDQGIVILKEGGKSNEVRAFYDFILSQKAQKIFTDFGYLIP